MKKILSLLVIMFQFVGYSQNNYWTVLQTKINSENTADQPLHFKQYNLDATNLLVHLKKATTFSGNSYSNVTIELPNEKGELIKFRIYEKSNFAPELAAKYPEIKSFIGISEKDKYTANISYSPYQGLNVAILNRKQSTTLIKPTIIGGNTYIVFSRNEISKENPFECEDVVVARTNNSALDTRNINDGFLRKYRVAVSTTAEFSQFWLDGTELTDFERKAKVIAAINVTLTRINGIFERDFSLTMELIANNDQVVYLNSNTDPYSGVSNSILQSTLDTFIGDANYDVGHLFHFEGTIHGNAGCIACVCTSGSKGSGWTGHSAPDSDNFNLIVAHEFGHQFGGWHVQSSSNCRSANEMQEVEPGSGSTIMGYAGICPANVQSEPDDYFNYVDIRDVIQWTRNDSSCAQLIASGNTTPTVNAGNDFTIPKSTPFILEGSGDDADGDTISFCWEENDPENPFSSSAPTSTRSQGPMFRSLLPVSESNRYMPNIADVAAGISPTWEVLPSISRTMDFVLTVRDNHAIGAQTASDEMTVTVDANAGPFVVTSQSSSETWNVGDSINLSWNVANTDQAPINCSNVDVFLSIDGGLTYPYTIATNIANNGSASLFLPNVPSTSQGRFMVRAKNNIFYAINTANITIQASEFIMNFTNIHEQSCKPNDVVFNFTYQTFLGFNETTTFSAQNLPSGATITFNPPTAVTDGTTVQAIISNTSAIALGEHNIIIRGTSASSEKNVNVSFTIFDSTIAIPTLTNPVNGATSIDPFGTLSWNNDVNAENYTIEIATDATFTNSIETATVATNEYQPSNLNYDTTYYWRVKTNNTCGSSSYSNVFNFTTFCVAPSYIDVNNVLIDNALVSWTENGNATSWEIEIVPVGNTPTGIGVLTATNPYTISGLNSLTEYVVYVRSSCGSGNFSDWISSNSFTTAADFCSGDHFYDTGGASNPYSDGENYTVTIAPSAGNNTVMVTFNSFNLESGYDYLNVYDGSDINAPLLGYFSGSTIPGPFTSNNPNGTLTFWFISDGSVTYSGWDATVTCLNITCPTPNSFTAQNISYNSLDLSWNAGDSESAWEIEYGLTGFSQGSGTLFQTSTNPQSITGLNPNTTYDFYIRANCGANIGDDDSLWVGPITATTLVSCPQPFGIYVNTTYNSAEVSWTPGGLETNWEIEYGLYGFTQGSGTLVQTGSNPYTITGLNPDTAYQVYIRANCGANVGDDDSNWNGPIYFYTQSLPGPSNLTTSLDQNTGSVTLNWDAANYNGNSDFETYYIYRDGALVATSVSETYTDNLPIYGNYYYYVRAKYNQGESYSTNTEYILWESCPAPSNLIASNETINSVDLSWDIGYSETAWEIEYGNFGFNQETGTYVLATTNPFTLSGLNHSTKYDVYLRANCGTNPGDDDSNWIGPITFSTLCNIYTAPYIENVEAFNGDYEIENCWLATPLASSGNYTWKIASYGTTPSTGTGPSQANSGSTFFFTEASNGYTGAVAELLTPIIDISSLTVPQLSFYYHMYGSNMGSLHVDVLNNGNWTNDVIIIDGQQQTSGTSPWMEQALVLNAFTGNIQIRFRGIRGANYESDIAIDDIKVIEAPTCPQPTNFTENNITASTVELSWTNGNTETNWEIEYGNAGFTQGTGTTIAVTTNPYTLTNLNPLTDYDVYIRAICGTNPGDDDSTWVGPISFSTICGIYTTPFLENVEAFNGDYEIENCWLATPLASSGNYTWKIASYGTTPSTGTGPSQANSGSTFFFTEASNGYTGAVAELLTPIIDISSLTVPQLSFYYHMYGSNMGSLHVDVLNNGNWTNDVIIIDGQQQTSGTSPWMEQALVLNAFTGNIQIRFRGIRGANYESDIAIDDIKVIEAPTCPQPTNFTENNITASTVELSWTNGNTETNWEIEYGNAGFTQGTGTTIAVTTNPYTLTNLNPLTDYDVYIRAICGTNPGDDDSTWLGPITFTTETLAKPHNLTASLDDASGEVILNWNQTSSFYEDFTDGVADNWIPVTGDWNVSNDTYNVTKTTHDTSTAYYNQDFSNFEFEVKAKKSAGNDCNISIYFNGDPSDISTVGGWNNGYSLMYCNNGDWKLVKIINGNWVNIVVWTYSPEINTGYSWNVIKVVYVDGYINAYINDVLLGTYYDITFPSGKVGIKMYEQDNNNIEFGKFDYISLTDLSNTTTNYIFNIGEVNNYRNIYSFGDCSNEETCGDNEIIGIEAIPIPQYGNNYTYTPINTNIFQNYKIYRDGVEIGTSIPETYTDQLPAYGDYQYYVTSIYDEGESLPSNTVNVSWHGTPNIVVNPLSLTQTLYTNQTATQQVTISNTGDDDLNFTIDSSVVNTNYDTIGFGNIETENLTPYTVENSLEEIIKTPTFSKRTYFNTTYVPNILIYEETVNNNYYIAALVSLGYTFTQVSSWDSLEFALNDGTNWDLVIANSYNAGASSTVLTALDTYQSNGGLLIFAEWSVVDNASHSIFTNMGIYYVSDIINPINFSATDTNHPIFNSPNQINSFTWSNNQYNIDGQIVNLINGATQLAAFDGYPNNGAIVLNANQNCIFNAFQSDNFHNDDNTNGKADIQELIENEINFLIGSSWLSTTQTSGAVLAGSLVTVDVNFDSTDLAVGTYNGTVAISSNDPDQPVVNIAAQLIVIDNTDSVNDLAQFNFTYYPNPFENSISLQADENFTSIKVFSLLGQELMNIVPDNSSQVTIDTSKLSIGTYFMKVEINGKIASTKIIKK